LEHNLQQAQYYNHELLNSDIRELISNRPHWIVRKGNTIFLILITGVLFLCWIIKYPEIITATYFSSSPQTYVEVKTSAAAYGKIKPGQKVVIKTKNNGADKIIYLQGKVISVSFHGSDSLLILADFFSNKNSLSLKDFKTPAEIIIGNKRVLSSLMEQLKKMWQ
jgi:hypothetical protein